MSSDFPGWNLPTGDVLDEHWESAVFAVDSNVLLNCYRYSSGNRKDLLSALGGFEDRLWIPHQAAQEFHRNRMDVLLKQRSLEARLRSAVEDGRKRLRSEVSKKVSEVSRRDGSSFTEAIDQSFTKLIGELIEIEQDHHSGLGDPAINSDDPVFIEISDLIDGRIGSEFDGDRLEEILGEAESRYATSMPPGYLDAEKSGDNSYGDVVLWFQLLEHAAREKKPIVLVTDDQKEDWFWKVQGRTLGPRPELVEEMLRESKQLFHAYGPAQFLQIYKSKSGSELKDEALAELEDSPRLETISDQTSGLDSHWTSAMPQEISESRHGSPKSWSDYERSLWLSKAREHMVGPLAVHARSLVGHSEVRLILHDPSQRLRGELLSCQVGTPSGEWSDALVGPHESQFRYETVYPDFFRVGTSRLEKGVYSVSWLAGGSNAPLATDQFVIGIQP